MYTGSDGADFVVLSSRFGRINDMAVYVDSSIDVASNICIHGKCNFKYFEVFFGTITMSVRIRHNDRHHYIIILRRYDKKCSIRIV